MRVVAGMLGGRRLKAPPGQQTRPTSDRVRQAIFNGLESRGILDQARVVDAFAGSGAMGIEALSRGARHCTFIECDRQAVSVVEANLTALGLRDRAEIVAGDALDVIGRLEDRDIAFCDPPYRFDEWDDLLGRLNTRWVVAESNREITSTHRLHVSQTRRYGTTVVTLLERSSTPTPRGNRQ